MWKQIKLLTGIQLRDSSGFNEAKYSHDKKKKKRAILMGAVFIYLAIVVVGYISASCVSYVLLGIPQIIPSFLLAITSIIIFMFTLVKSGDMIFNMKAYEKTIVLPVKASAIVISRFLTVYIIDLVLSALIIIPGFTVYSIYIHPPISFFVYSLLGLILLPLLPLTVTSLLGACIMAISCRMKHKNFVTVTLSIILTLGILFVTTFASFNSENISEIQFAQISDMIISKIEGIYPPAKLFSDAVLNGNILSFILFAATYIIAFVIFVYLVQWKFAKICSALNASAAKHNYKMQKLTQNSPLKALYIKELKRYFSSNIYVMNTLTIYLLGLITSIAILVIGSDKIDAMIGIPQICSKYMPIVLSLIFSMSPTTTSSISLEGGKWWILQSLPVKTKSVFDSKILVNLTIGIPFYIVSVILVAIAVKPSFIELLPIVIVPLVYLIFSTVLGLTVNAAMPMMEWESETVPVKQGGAVLVTMLIGLIGILVTAVPLFVFPNVSSVAIMALGSFVIAIVTFILYKKNNKINLSNIR